MHLSRHTFDALCNRIHQLTGIVITKEREYLVRHRLEPIIARRGLAGFEELQSQLNRGIDRSLTNAVIDAITTQETSFFRDAGLFDVLAKEVFPAIARTAVSPVRIWCAGTSTGQEAYSLAILAREFAEGHPSAHWNRVTVVGTDVSAAAIEKARSAVYPSRDLQRGLSPQRQARFFQQSGPTFSVSDSLRKMVEWRQLSLMDPCQGLGQFQLISCRNVMIYFDEGTRQRLCDLFYRMLTEPGWLVLGAAENLYGIKHGFASQSFGNLLIYRKG